MATCDVMTMKVAGQLARKAWRSWGGRSSNIPVPIPHLPLPLPLTLRLCPCPCPTPPPAPTSRPQPPHTHQQPLPDLLQRRQPLRPLRAAMRRRVLRFRLPPVHPHELGLRLGASNHTRQARRRQQVRAWKCSASGKTLSVVTTHRPPASPLNRVVTHTRAELPRTCHGPTWRFRARKYRRQYW